MAAPVPLNTPRGTYRLSVVEQSTTDAGAWRLTLVVEHASGLEKLAFRCHIGVELMQRTPAGDVASICARLAPWLEGQFEQVREAALRSIRSEGRLAEVEFDSARPGPF